MFDQLALADVPWNRVHLFSVDERIVPPTDAASNYKLANEHLIQPAGIPERNIHRIYGEMSPEAAAARYVEDLREFFRLESGQFPHFDLVHLGLGPDGHFASLFPNDSLTNDRDGIAAAAYSQATQLWRVTLLPGTLLSARHTVFLVAGADKQEAVRATFYADYNPRKYPAQISAREGRDVTWFLDEAAARLLHQGN